MRWDRERTVFAGILAGIFLMVLAQLLDGSHSALITFALGLLLALAGIFTGRHMTLREIERTQAQYDIVLNAVQDVVFLLAVEPESTYRFMMVNAAFLRVTGLSLDQIVSRTIEQVIPAASIPFVRRRYAEAIALNRPVTWTETSEYPTGILVGEVTVIPIHGADGHVTHLIGTVHDITGQRQIERTLRENEARFESERIQMQKMEIVGRLAGGVAHDFNNVLTAILGTAELALDAPGLDDQTRIDLQAIQHAALRATALTRQLLTFARRQVLDLETIDLNQLITDHTAMLRRLIGEDIELRLLLQDTLPPIQVDVTQIEQVLANLVINARDAMPHGGTITIQTRTVVLTEPYVETHAMVEAGEYVLMTVSDTGCGMPAEVREQAFEPFFTTKPQGKGTGLGLSTVYGIMKAHHGSVLLYSEVDHGTSVKCYVPLPSEAVRASHPIVEGGTPMRQDGHETVLLVEDEEFVRAFLARVLRGRGYTVIEAANGERAIAVAQTLAAPVQVLLTDVVMPQMGGQALAEHFRQRWPDMKVLFMSGYSSETANIDRSMVSGAGFIQKPISASQLAQSVRALLDQ